MGYGIESRVEMYRLEREGNSTASEISKATGIGESAVNSYRRDLKAMRKGYPGYHNRPRRPRRRDDSGSGMSHRKRHMEYVPREEYYLQFRDINEGRMGPYPLHGIHNPYVDIIRALSEESTNLVKTMKRNISARYAHKRRSSGYVHTIANTPENAGLLREELKDLCDIGMIEKYDGSNRKFRYKLTDHGAKVKKRISELFS